MNVSMFRLPRGSNINSKAQEPAALQDFDPADVRVGSKTEVAVLRQDVCFCPMSGHRQAVSACPFCAPEAAIGAGPRMHVNDP
jgi:hypothetical protein